MKKGRTLGLAVAVLGSLTLVLWIAWRPTPDAPGVLEANGRIEGDQAAVAPKVGGRIVRLAVGEGDRLAAGQLIVELASEQVEARLQQTEHAHRTARAQLAEAEARQVSARRRLEEAELAVASDGVPQPPDRKRDEPVAALVRGLHTLQG